jgi:hypothetical protein
MIAARYFVYYATIVEGHGDPGQLKKTKAFKTWGHKERNPASWVFALIGQHFCSSSSSSSSSSY